MRFLWLLAALFAGPAAAEPPNPEAAMQLYRIILPVSDIDRAERFYAEVTGMAGERVSPGRHYFDLGGTILALYDPIADGDESLGSHHQPHPNQYIYLATSDLPGAVERAVRAGAPASADGIQNMPWGERLYYTLDPFGNPLCIVDENTLFRGSGREPGDGDE